jgi:DNA-binding transcriptional LysR family regulator
MLNPVHLETFVDVMRTGSLALTARRLGYTPSAVSQQIAALERATRVKLFERSASAVRPTTAAHQVLEEVQAALGGVRTLEASLQALASGENGVVRLGSFPSASQRLVPALLARLQRASAGLQVQLDEAEPKELAAMARASELDLALVYAYDHVPEQPHEGETVELVLTERLALVAASGHSAVDDGRTSLAALAGEPWIATRKGSAAHAVLQRVCAQHDFEPRISHQTNDYAVIQELVAAGLGIAIVPALAVVPDPRRVVAPLDDRRAVRRIKTCIYARDPSPAVIEVLRCLRSSVRSVAADDPLLEPTLRP